MSEAALAPAALHRVLTRGDLSTCLTLLGAVQRRDAVPQMADSREEGSLLLRDSGGY